MNMNKLLVCILMIVPLMAMAQGDYKKNINAAMRGDANAQCVIGYCYYSGQDVKKDYAQAVYWYLKAAEQNNSYAQVRLGDCYYLGRGVSRNYSEAAEWFKKASAQGHSFGQLNLGLCYLNGKGVSKNLMLALSLFKKAAVQGNAAAQFQLGHCYENGIGVDIDYAQAVYWYRKAADQGNKDAHKNLPAAEENLIKHEKAVYRKYLDAATKGDKWAQYEVGNCYFQGKGVTPDDSKGVEWTLKAAEQGVGKAQLKLGNCYHYGIRVVKDYDKAVEWYRKAANQGEVEAEFYLGYCYYLGNGVEKDFKQAIEWFRMAAEKGYSEAQFYLGFCYDNGQGVAQDYEQAVAWYSKAANQGNANAIKWLPKAEEYLKEQQTVALNNNNEPSDSTKSAKVSDVDNNIPLTQGVYENTFAVIIGNEKYHDEANVPFAENDARIFSEYCYKTLGISSNHIRLLTNAGYNDIRKSINWLRDGMDAYGGKGRVIFYYAGHGLPNERNQSACLLPVDGIARDLESAYPLEKLYAALGEMPAQSVTVFLDACFSGTKRDGEMMFSARGVAIKVKASVPQGKMVVFSAAQGDETAYPYTMQKHGLFTYYLLKKLQETNGSVTLGELSTYITAEVKRKSFDVNNKMQTPTVFASPSMTSSWMTMKLR